MANTKVKVSGFEIMFSEGVKMNDFFQELESISKNKKINVSTYSTRVYTRIIENLVVGLILTFKDDKKRLATEKDINGKLKVNRIELKEHQASTEASLFCFNPSTQSGLFTHYAGAASISVYTAIFNQANKNIKQRLIDQRIDELSDFGRKGNTKIIRSRAQNEFHGSLTFKYIYQEKDLDQILSKLKNLSEVEVTTSLGVPQEPIFRHLGTMTKKTTQTINFLESFRAIENLKNHLSNFVKDALSQKEKNYALRLIGTSLAGERVQYWLGANIEEYGFFNYDDYVDGLPEDIWDNYANCDALINLINKVKEQNESFGEIEPVSSWGKYQSATDLQKEPVSPKSKVDSLINEFDHQDDESKPLQIEMHI